MIWLAQVALIFVVAFYAWAVITYDAPMNDADRELSEERSAVSDQLSADSEELTANS